MMSFKDLTHPAIKKIIEGGKSFIWRKSINRGGFQSLPKMFMPGALQWMMLVH